MNAPVTRRALLGATAAVGAAVLPAIGEAKILTAGFDHLDAGLFRLLECYPAALAAMRAAGDRCEALWKAFADEEPERPETLHVRPADCFLGVSRGEYLARDGRWTWMYEPSAAEEKCALPHASLQVDKRRIARRAEILDAHDAWHAECDEVKARLGIPEADAADDRATEAVNDLDAAILATAPATFAGLAAKARWAAQCRLGAVFAADWHKQIVEDVVALAEHGEVTA